MAGPAGSFAHRDIAYHVHPNTDMSAHEALGPHIVTSGCGIHVSDDHGRTLIEGMSGLWCVALGFSEPRLVEAARRQLENLPYNHNFAHRASQVSIELAEKLVSLSPPGLTKVHFVGSGSEANETIVKIVWYYNNLLGRPGKKKLIARRWAYHGSTIVAASLSGMPSMHEHYDLPLPCVLRVEAPHYHAGGRVGETEEDYATRLADDLEALIVEEGPDTIAAFFAEPVMGAGGVMLPPKTYFAKVQAILRKYDILFVADEVITGFGRTGEWFGSDLYGIEPDLMSIAKGLSSGYQPIGAVLLSEALYHVLVEGNRRTGYFANGFTNGGHPVAAAVALEALRIYEERAIVEHVRKMDTVFRDRLARLEAVCDLVGHTRGVGLIGGIELVSDRAGRRKFEPNRRAAAAVVTAAREEGLILRALPNDVVGICPPLIITAEEIGILFDRLERALGRVAASL